VVDGFFAHIRLLDDPETRIESKAKAEEAVSAVLRHLTLLFCGRYDGTYLEKRAPIADSLRTLQPSAWWFPWGYSVYFENLSRLAFDTYPEDPGKVRAFLAALWKVLLFDMEISRDTSLDRRVRRLMRQRDDLRATVDDRTRDLEASEKRYRELVENFPEIILFIQEDGTIQEANREIEGQLGYGREEVRGLSLLELFPESQRSRIEDHLDRLVRSGHDRVGAHLFTREGERKSVDLMSTAMVDETGRFLRARVFIRDITAREILEEERSKWERLVAVGSMAAKVAHEIRNPLSSISLNVELLLDEIRRFTGEDKKEAIDLVGSILSEIDRLGNVIAEYLSFGRLPSPSLEKVDIGDFLRMVAGFVRPDLEEHGIELSIEVREGTPPIFADPNQIRQGVLNLFRNAQEAMPDGGTLKVIAGGTEESVVIEFRDTGVGIPKEKIAKIFDPFYTTKDFGTGLGLAFVQQVMREHGGRVTCRSEVGEGTVFGLHFPLAKE